MHKWGIIIHSANWIQWIELSGVTGSLLSGWGVIMERALCFHISLTVILRPQLLFNIRKPFLIMRSYQTLRKGASTCLFFLDKYTSTHSPYYANQNCTQYSPSGPTKDALMFPIFILLFISMPLECCLASPISARPSVDNWLFHQTFTEHRPYKITAQRRNRPFGL